MVTENGLQKKNKQKKKTVVDHRGHCYERILLLYTNMHIRN